MNHKIFFKKKQLSYRNLLKKSPFNSLKSVRVEKGEILVGKTEEQTQPGYFIVAFSIFQLYLMGC